MLTQKELKEYLHYSPETGFFTWIKRSGDRIKIGSIAGCIKNDNNYRIIRLRKIYYAHRLAWLYMTGNWPENHIDHINGIRDDNRWQNLRDVSRSTNSRNSKLPITNTSGVIGVFFSNRDNVWIARIKMNGKTIHLGKSKDFEKVALLRKQAEIAYGFHENHGRRA